MKKLLLAVLIFTGCQKEMRKPFIIIQKRGYTNEWTAKIIDTTIVIYTYQAANGWERQFTDNPNKYRIGDTIK